MTISADLEAQILHCHKAEKWHIGKIARKVSVHHSTVRRVLMQVGLIKLETVPRLSDFDLYWPFTVSDWRTHIDMWLTMRSQMTVLGCGCVR